MIKIDKNPNGIATITINRPEKHNAFDDDTIEQLTRVFEDIDTDDSIRLMILAGNGKNFSAGGDLNWMKRMAKYNYQDNLADAKKLANMLKTLNSVSKPTIARVQGAAFGGAVGLVSCCDIAVGSESALFCLSEVKIGLTPATVSPYVIAALGERAARRYFLSAETFDAERAQQLGLLSEVCPADALDSTIQNICEKILRNSPAAVKAAKEVVRDIANKEITPELIEDTSMRIAKIRVSNEGQEGLSAFLEKRAPKWLMGKQAQNAEDSEDV